MKQSYTSIEKIKGQSQNKNREKEVKQLKDKSKENPEKRFKTKSLKQSTQQNRTTHFNGNRKSLRKKKIKKKV